MSSTGARLLRTIGENCPRSLEASRAMAWSAGVRPVAIIRCLTASHGPGVSRVEARSNDYEIVLDRLFKNAGGNTIVATLADDRGRTAHLFDDLLERLPFPSRAIRVLKGRLHVDPRKRTAIGVRQSAGCGRDDVCAGASADGCQDRMRRDLTVWCGRI